jgi:hypothetical protein
MRKILFLSALLATFSSYANFNDWFLPKTLRIDYVHAGDALSESYALDELKGEPIWGGSLVNLIDTMKMGEYYFKAFDVATNTLIYSKGYCALFDEWQCTEEAKHTRRSFIETVIMPFPKKDVRIEFYSRSLKGIYEKMYEFLVNVNSYFITPERNLVFPAYNVLISGDPSVKIDIVILPEGYTASEMGKFKADCNKFTQDFFSFPPYSENRDKFNIRAVLAPSAESGADVPGKNTWKNTILNSGFFTFDSERYLMTFDDKSVRDLSANAPYDQIYILVNTSKYGGGAIYNFYSCSVNSNPYSAKIYVHEFGHCFAGLGDEYDDGTITFNEMYPHDIEPWEPNLTTLVDFEHKWKNILPAGTSIPSKIEPDNPTHLGVYEGGGYVSKGVYRPTPDCLMRSFKGNEFCPVCKRAIQAMINFQTR